MSKVCRNPSADIEIGKKEPSELSRNMLKGSTIPNENKIGYNRGFRDYEGQR